jgi:hypothetical protein
VAQAKELFGAETRELPSIIKEQGSLGRYLVVLGNPQKEALVAKLLEPTPEKAGAAAAPVRAEKVGLWASLTRWFRK